jgi:hypothetical protein
MSEAMDISRRAFIVGIGGLGLITLVGCTEQPRSRYKNRQQDKPGPHASNKNRKDNRKYPCGLIPSPLNPASYEYVVVTTARYTVYINGRATKRSKTFILCGQHSAAAWRRDHPLDLVRQVAP